MPQYDYEHKFDNTFIVNSRAYYFDGTRWYESIMWGDNVQNVPIDRAVVSIAASAAFDTKQIDIVSEIERQHARHPR